MSIAELRAKLGYAEGEIIEREVPVKLASSCPRVILRDRRLCDLTAQRASATSLLRGATVRAAQADVARSVVHRLEEFPVVLRLLQLVEQELDGVLGAHRVEDPAKHIDLLEILRI